ncbi:hypothetical protein TEA_019784 [Camellia sinensis var. sinensis]|uniref:Uncharacterized protein n=1 Tax=Camellia sinensis var. sinensis TaxID=542762 RepID=A0A4S4DSM9_CAMSN|nr:hypothetical protein TEA_019784 [Camellia sinensis var. sinensis]
MQQWVVKSSQEPLGREIKTDKTQECAKVCQVFLLYGGFFSSMAVEDIIDADLSDFERLFVLPYFVVPSSLKTLYLQVNNLGGSIHVRGLDGLKHIQVLYLDYSFIDKSFLYNVGVMSSLKVLTLCRVRLNGSPLDEGEIPIEVGKLSNIHALNLCHSNLTGSIPTTFSHLRQIESLDLSYNNLNGRILSIDRIRQIGSLHCGTQQLIRSNPRMENSVCNF